MRKTLREEKIYDVIVIGAGFAGFFTARELARYGKEVAVVERGDGLLGERSSSYNECYKLHLGVHYAGDPDTAVQCLKNSVRFAREFPELLLGHEDPRLPWRHGRHYLMSNSFFNEETVRKTSALLQRTYAELVQQDPANKVFGEPDDFIRYLGREEYPYVAETIPQPDMPDGKNEDARVVLGIETPESQIDINQFRRYAERELSQFGNLTFATWHEVKRIQFLPDSLDYQVDIFDHVEKKAKQVRAKGIVNCAWHNIESLDRDLGYYTPDNRLVRLKVSLLVYLPEELYRMNTCIFFVGPHCSITNLGDKTAIVTYEPATNVGHYVAGHDPLRFGSGLADVVGQELRAHEGRGKTIANAIMDGAKRYVPALGRAVVKEIRVGYVKIFVHPKKTYDIFLGEGSSHHDRKEDGVEKKGLAYLSHSGMKMTFTWHNAVKIRETMDHHFVLRQSLEHLIEAVKVKFTVQRGVPSYPMLLVNTILYHTLRTFMLSMIRITFDNADQLVDPRVVDCVEKAVINCLTVKRNTHAALMSFFEERRSGSAVSSEGKKEEEKTHLSLKRAKK